MQWECDKESPLTWLSPCSDLVLLFPPLLKWPPLVTLAPETFPDEEKLDKTLMKTLVKANGQKRQLKTAADVDLLV